MDLFVGWLSSQYISVLHLCGRNSVSGNDQAKEQDKSECQVLISKSHSVFAKYTRWRVVDCIPKLQQSRGII